MIWIFVYSNLTFFPPLIPEKVMDRNSWRAALENGNYELLNPESKENGLTNKEEEQMEIDENHIRVKDRLFHFNICYLCIFICVFKQESDAPTS